MSDSPRRQSLLCSHAVVVSRAKLFCVALFATALWSSSIAQAADPQPVDLDLLGKAAVYEINGQLKTTDTRLHFGDGAFTMDKARYRAKLNAKLDGKSPIEYRHMNHRLAFTPIGLYWSGTSTDQRTPVIKEGINAVEGRLAKLTDELDGQPRPQSIDKGVVYQDAYGPGLDLSVLTENLEFRKIAKIDRRESLGTISESAEFLDLRFAMDVDGDTYFKAKFGAAETRIWNQKKTLTSKGEGIEFGRGGESSFIKPAYAWDSAGEKIPLQLEFSHEAGQLILTKRIPTAWLKKATFPVYADATIAYEAAVVFNAAAVTEVAVTRLDSTHIVVAYIQGMNGMGIVGLISGTTLTFPSAAVNYNWATHAMTNISTLDSTHVIVAYSNTSGGDGQAVVGTITGTTIAFDIGNLGTYTPAAPGPVSLAALDATHFVVAYGDANNSNHGTAIVGLVTGTTVTFPTAATVFLADLTAEIAVTALDSTHVAIAYADVNSGSAGTARIGLIAGTAISFPSGPTVFDASTCNYISAAALDSTHFVISYSDNGTADHGAAIVGIVSGGTVVTFPSAAAIYEAASTWFTSITALDSTHVVIGYQDQGNGNFGTAIVGDIAGTAITFPDPAAVFESANTEEIWVAAIDATHFVTGYMDKGNTDHGTAIFGTVSFGAANGAACNVGGDCISTFCVDGVCCNNACAGGTTDCQACSTAAGAAANGTCGVANGTTVCRPAFGSCDITDFCDGTNTTCTANLSVNDGVGCSNDASKCNGFNTCQSGSCKTGAPVVCDDSNECTTDSCVDPAATCTFTAVTNGAPCSGGICTEGGCTVMVPDASVDGAGLSPDATVDATVDAGTPTTDSLLDGLIMVSPDATVDATVDTTFDTVVVVPPPDAQGPTSDTMTDTTIDTTTGPTADATVDATWDTTAVSFDSTVDSTVDTLTPAEKDAEPGDAKLNTDTNGSGNGDGGNTANDDATAVDDGPSIGGEPTPNIPEGGCNCTLDESKTTSSEGLFVSLLLLGWLVNRRRRFRQ